jgi:hypothetical protein
MHFIEPQNIPFCSNYLFSEAIEASLVLTRQLEHVEIGPTLSTKTEIEFGAQILKKIMEIFLPLLDGGDRIFEPLLG